MSNTEDEVFVEHDCETNTRNCPFCDEDFCKGCAPCLAKAQARISVLEKVIEDANNILFDAQCLDIEHSIDSHLETLPIEFRRVAIGSSQALEILQVVIAEKVGG